MSTEANVDNQVAAPVEPAPTDVQTTAEPTPFSWPDQWRAQVAGGDEKEAARLERFASPADVYKSFREFEKKQSSGQLKAAVPFPEKGTDQEKASWRAEQGIPELPEKYEVKLSDGVVIGTEDKPIVDSFLKAAHAGNMRPQDVNQAVGWYFEQQRAAVEAQALKDKQIAQQNTNTLRQEWGADFQVNMGAINELFSKADPEISDAFLKNGRLADGTAVASHPGILKWLAQVARENNPISTLINSGSTPESIDQELNNIVAKMGDKHSDYYKGPNAEGMQKRFRDLTEAKQTMDKRR